MVLGPIGEAEAMMHEPDHTGIHDAVVDVGSVTTGGEDAQIYQTSKLIGDGLGLHAYGLSEIPHAGVVHPDERM
jgi:hypothetical protein